MARARKCDICGRLYESYNMTGNKNKPNGITFVSITDADTYSRVLVEPFNEYMLDCCPACRESIREHVKSLKK